MPCAPCTSTPAWPTSRPNIGDDSLTDALKILWDDLTTKQMYVTGGIGPAAQQRGLHRRLRPAQRKRLCRDLRLGRPRHAGPSRMLGRAPTGAMPTSWNRRSTTARCRACRSDGAHLLLRKPAGKRGRAPPLDLAPLPLLPAQHRPAGRGDRHLHVWRSRPTRSPSICTAKARPAEGRIDAASRSTQEYRLPLEADGHDTVWTGPPSLVRPALRMPDWCKARKALHRRRDRSMSRPSMIRGYLRIDRLWQRRRDDPAATCRWTSAPCHANPAVKADSGASP